MYANLFLALQAGHSQEIGVAIRALMQLFLTMGMALTIMVSTTQGIMAGVSVDSTSTTAGVLAMAIECRNRQVDDSCASRVSQYQPGCKLAYGALFLLHIKLAGYCLLFGLLEVDRLMAAVMQSSLCMYFEMPTSSR